MYTSQAVVIDNGSDTTKAGFANDDLPSLIFNTNYLKGPQSDKAIIGDDEIDKYPNNEVFTLLENGIIYDFDNVTKNWEYVYDNLDNSHKLDSLEFPLTMTQAYNNPDKNKIKTSEIVFEQFNVPIFSLVKKPLCHLYNFGQSTGCVVNIGSSLVSFTSILDGVIQNKYCFKTSYAGNFTDANILNFLNKQNVDLNLWGDCTESYKNYQLSKKIVKDFKISMLRCSEIPIVPTTTGQIYNRLSKKYFQLPNKQYVPVLNEQVDLLESLFSPSSSELVNQPVKLEDPSTQGLPLFILLCLKNMESNLLSIHQNNYHKVAEMMKVFFNHTYLTGNSALLDGLSLRINSDSYAFFGKYFPNYPSLSGPIINSDSNMDYWDRQVNSWIGASNLSLMLNSNSDIVNDWFVSKQDYAEFGNDYILEKFK